jgi:uncharacterized membrane protein
MSENKGKTSTGMQPNIAGLLCYLGWWVTAIIFLILEKENKFVRFHAMQSLITFGVLFIISLALSWVFFIGYILWVLSVVLWVILMYKAYKGEKYKLPVIGDIAEKQIK